MYREDYVCVCVYMRGPEAVDLHMCTSDSPLFRSSTISSVITEHNAVHQSALTVQTNRVCLDNAQFCWSCDCSRRSLKTIYVCFNNSPFPEGMFARWVKLGAFLDCTGFCSSYLHLRFHLWI